MSTIEVITKVYEFNRGRTLSLLGDIEKMPSPQEVLAWRPSPGRAHIGWQLMHIALTEEIFATERLISGRPGKWSELWPRFRGGSTPDDDVPSATTIRQILDETRPQLLATLSTIREDQLDEVPPALAERKWNRLAVLHIIGWHEAHHQGQAHATLNAYKASQKLVTA